MPEFYPPSVASARVALTANSAHRRGVLRLLLGLFGFAAVYLALLTGCVAAPVLLIRLALVEPWLWPAAGAASLLFGSMLFVLLRGLGHRPGIGAEAIEVTHVEQPRLFEFLERLAADAHAPMPDRVSLSPGVNAAMLRSASALGLLFGGPRELVLGLGLVNVLDLRELKAALAHELGHFSQSSARLGQWAYRTTVVLRELVLGRDRFDERLARARASKSGLVRALAWLPSVGVRGIRTVLGRVLAQVSRSSLALARELEFNADLHAVALTGSDPIVAALWAAQRGALAYDWGLAAVRELGKHGLFSEDLYAHQHARWDEFEARTASATEPMLLALRSPYRWGPAAHFPSGQAPAEVMWYSHPSYAEREANAKREYVESDAGAWPSAWVLFDDEPALRRRATVQVYARLGFPAARDPQQLRPAAELEQRIADELAEREQGRHYFGFYANRIVAFGDLDERIAEAETTPIAALDEAVAAWRGAALEQFMDRWRANEAALARGGRAPDLEDRERLRGEARTGDQALFHWLWRHADPAQQAELVERIRFMDFVQAQIIMLNHHQSRVGPLLAAAEALAELDDALVALHHDLHHALVAGESVRLPPLRNLDAGGTTRAFLLGDAVLVERDPQQPLRTWLQAFMPQVAGVHERLRTLHYKNLGQWLALCERIEIQIENP